MASFPLLKTGAVAQYPLALALRSDTQTVRFLDGSSQQFRLTKPLRRWKIDLVQIDSQELDSVITFVEQQEGATFSFDDPFTGDAVPKCIISNSGLITTSLDEMKHDASLVIEEVA